MKVFSLSFILAIACLYNVNADELILQNGIKTGSAEEIYSGQTDLVISQEKSSETMYYPTLGINPEKTGSTQRGLLRWDLEPVEDLFSSGKDMIVSCELTLAIWYNNLIPGQKFTVHEVLPASGSWTAWGKKLPRESSWNFLKKSENKTWAGEPGCGKPGVDYVAEPLATLKIDDLTSANPRFQQKVYLPIELVRRWAENPESNHGLLLKSCCEENGFKPAQTAFVFSHVTNPRWHENYFPKLSIRYLKPKESRQPAGDGFLFRDGKCDFIVVIPDHPAGTEELAANEFVGNIKKMTGFSLPVMSESVYRSEFGPYVSIGLTGFANKLIDKDKLKSLGDEGYLYLTDSGNLIMAGGRRRGSLYAVYEYLEQLGVRWFTPSFTHIPELSEVRLPKTGEYVPKVFYRDQLWNNRGQGYRQWVAHMRLNGEYARLPESLGGSSRTRLDCHSYHMLVPFDELAKHPDWQAMKQDGVRRGGSKHSLELCVTNSELRSYLVRRVKEELKAHPGTEFIWVSQDDGNHSGCFCPECTRERVKCGGVDTTALLRKAARKTNRRDPLDSGDIAKFAWSANAISLANFVGESIKDEFPNVRIKTLAYSYTWTTPKNLKMADNVVVVLCGPSADWFNSYSITRSEITRKWWNELQRWGRLGGNVQLYTYGGSNYGYWWPFPTWFSTCEILQDANKLGCNALYVQGAAAGFGSGFVDLRAYLNARTMFRPAQDFHKDFYEFTEAFYGPAAKHIRNYLLWFDKYIKDNKISAHHNWGNDEGWRDWITPEIIRKSEELLLSALAAAKGQGEDFEKRALAAYMPTLCVKILSCILKEPMITKSEIFFVKPERMEEVQEMARLFSLGMKQNSYNRWNEQTAYDPYTSRIARVTKRHKLYTLKNDKIALTVAPSLGGRLLSLQAKGFKRNLFRTSGGNLKAGYEEYFDGDLQSKSAKIDYEVKEADKYSIRLGASLDDGLEVSRLYKLEADRPLITISSTYKNTGTKPVKVKLRSHPEFDYNVFRKFHIYIDKDNKWDKVVPGDSGSKMINLWFEPTPSRVDRNMARWLLGDENEKVGILHTYDLKDVEKSYYFSGKQFGCINMELFGAPKELQPGTSTTLSQSFEVIYDLARMLKK